MSCFAAVQIEFGRSSISTGSPQSNGITTDWSANAHFMLSDQKGRTMAEIEFTDKLRDETKQAWYRYLELAVPFRAVLHRYCRSLTGDPWNALRATSGELKKS